MSEDFVKIVRNIEANPLGRLMYGQRELFHSNLLAWLFDTLPAVADSVFQPFTRPGAGVERRVERERAHLDLIMHWRAHAPLAIENKVFSIPNLGQLKEYEKVTKAWPEEPCLLLLSVSDPGFDPGPWQTLSYATLASRLDEALPRDETYNVATVRKYIELISNLDRLVAAVDIRSVSEPVWVDEAVLRAVTSPQMRAALQKARAQRVARAVNDELRGTTHLADSGMSNATPIVQSLVEVRVDGTRLALGWQLQGTQFRRAVVYIDSQLQGGSEKKRAKREALSRTHPDLFRFPPFLPQEHAGRKEFNHYAPGFVYQYVKTPDLTVAQLCEAAEWVHNAIEAARDDR